MGNRTGASIDNANHLFIERHDLKVLRRLLHGIPELATELGIAVTKQARLGEVGRSRKPRRPSEQPLPYNLQASEVAEELHNFLTGWARLVCEQRAIEYQGPTSTPGVANWLERHVYSLAMTEGAETVLPELEQILKAAEFIVCPPARPITVDAAKYARARKVRLNASGIAVLAQELGEEYRNLTARRVRVLRDAGLIAPIPGPWRPDWPDLYQVGDVLDAHLTLPIRERHAKAS